MNLYPIIAILPLFWSSMNRTWASPEIFKLSPCVIFTIYESSADSSSSLSATSAALSILSIFVAGPLLNNAGSYYLISFPSLILLPISFISSFLLYISNSASSPGMISLVCCGRSYLTSWLPGNCVWCILLNFFGNAVTSKLASSFSLLRFYFCYFNFY